MAAPAKGRDIGSDRDGRTSAEQARAARAAGGSPPGRRSRCWWLLCAIIAAINPNFLSFGNFVRISQAAMIPLVLGLGATFIILMGSIDLSVEGVLTLGRGDPVACWC